MLTRKFTPNRGMRLRKYPSAAYVPVLVLAETGGETFARAGWGEKGLAVLAGSCIGLLLYGIIYGIARRTVSREETDDA